MRAEHHSKEKVLSKGFSFLINKEKKAMKRKNNNNNKRKTNP
jgi:hypothetical protein